MSLILVAGCTPMASADGNGASLPPAAAAAGYSMNTFSANFTSANTDLNRTGAGGYAWYPWDFFSTHAQASNIQLNADGSVTLAGDTTGPNGQLSTVVPTGKGGFAGTAFGGGGYFEATFKFDPETVINANLKGWPSFWSMAVEHLAQGRDGWPGQAAGFAHYIEADFFEYDVVRGSMPRNYFGGNMHDWYGVWKVTCQGTAFCNAQKRYEDIKIELPKDTDFTQYHRYGYLWVPATATTPGSAQHYFDGKPVGSRVVWAMLRDDHVPTPDNQPWKFGIIDKDHLVLLLGTGPGEPMTVKSVNVWQASSSGNLRY